MRSRNPRKTGNTRNLFVLVGMCVFALSLTAWAQPAQPEPPQPPAVPEILAQVPQEPDFDRFRRGVVRIGQDYTMGSDERVREVFVLRGNVTIRGQVTRDVVVILGTATIAETAVIEQDLVVIGGQATIQSGARVQGDLVVVGASLDAPVGYQPGREQVLVNPPILGGSLTSFFPWITRGLFYGRLIVPDLPWVWFMVGGFFLLYLLINAVADQPVRASAAVLVERPLTAFGAGLLVLLLMGPVSALLAVSVIGIAVIPFVTCAIFLAGLLGRVAVMRWTGMRLTSDIEVNTPGAAVRVFAIGFGLLTLIYMVPLIGIATWACVGVFGLGAATVAFFDSYRRERPPTPLPEPPPAPREPPFTPPLGEPHVTTPGPASLMSAGEAPPGGPPPAIANGSTYPLAQFRDRFAAAVLDLILVAVVISFLGDEDVILPFFIAYCIAFWAWKHTSVGGIICQLRIVRVNGQPLTFADALVRGLSSIFSLVVVGLGYLWILWDPERQAWHDKIAGTYVVKVPRNYPL